MTAAILAGGRSIRMGRDKALLPVGGRRMIEGIVEALRPLFPEIVIIADLRTAYGDLGAPVSPDRIPDKGPLGGLYTALSESGHPYTFCIACDMPFVDPGVVAYLTDRAEGSDVVVPWSAAGFEPLHAVYAKRCLPSIEAMLAEDRLKVESLFSRVRVRRVPTEELRRLDPELRCFCNVNTPEELRAAARWLDETRVARCES
jgi:molybdopterin-guanine dinucleotide biosynthesis protein A